MENADQLATGSKPAPGDLAFVQGFVNTYDLETGQDALSDPAGLAGWLRRHGLLDGDDPIGAEDLRRAIEFREAVRTVLQSHNGEPLDPEAIATLQRTAATLPLRLRYTAAGGVVLEPTATGLDGALARLHTVIYRAIRDGTWPRLKACRNDRCHWAFYDASRNRSGAWCTMEVCGNRMKVRAHRRRKAQEDEAQREG